MLSQRNYIEMYACILLVSCAQQQLYTILMYCEACQSTSKIVSWSYPWWLFKATAKPVNMVLCISLPEDSWKDRLLCLALLVAFWKLMRIREEKGCHHFKKRISYDKHVSSLFVQANLMTAFEGNPLAVPWSISLPRGYFHLMVEQGTTNLLW